MINFVSFVREREETEIFIDYCTRAATVLAGGIHIWAITQGYTQG